MTSRSKGSGGKGFCDINKKREDNGGGVKYCPKFRDVN